MARLPILEYPDPRLRTRAKPVAAVTDTLRTLADDMLETMYAAPGIGLAATQVDVHKRLVVIDVSEEGDQPLVLFNPEWQALGEEEQASDEGCLSVPGFYEPVQRMEQIRVRYLDRDGEPAELDASGLLAVCIQHECDHLEGKLFVDYVSGLKRQRIRRRLEKQQRLRA